MSARFEPFDPGRLAPAARAVHDEIAARRGYVPGPYRFWLAAPELVRRIEPVEEHLRYGVSLDERHVEILVLAVARHWKAQYVWTSHAPAAEKAGVDPAAVEAIRTGRAPAFAREDDAACHAFCRALLDAHEVDDALWDRARAAFGEAGVNEMFALLGLYTAVCATMVAYRMPTKGGEPDPLA